MRGIIAVIATLAMLTVGAVVAVAAPSPNSEATITFSLNTATCQLTINSSKDISNYTVNGVKTEGVTTPSVTISVKNGDVITVKSGTSTASFTVSGCGTVVPPPPVVPPHDHGGGVPPHDHAGVPPHHGGVTVPPHDHH